MHARKQTSIELKVFSDAASAERGVGVTDTLWMGGRKRRNS